MKKIPLVAHVFLHSNNSILLIRRTETGFQDGNYGLVGGHLNPGETIKQAAIRECYEEIGVEISETDLEIIGVSHYNSRYGEGIDFFLVTKTWKGDPFIKSECDEIKWCISDNLPENIIPFIKRAISIHFVSRKWFDEIGWEPDTLEYV